MAKIDPNKINESPSHRMITMLFGLLFTGMAVGILLVADFTVGPLVAAAVLGVLGINGLLSAYYKKESWLARIGPLF